MHIQIPWKQKSHTIFLVFWHTEQSILVHTALHDFRREESIESSAVGVSHGARGTDLLVQGGYTGPSQMDMFGPQEVHNGGLPQRMRGTWRHKPFHRKGIYSHYVSQVFYNRYFKNFSTEKPCLPQGPLWEDRGTPQEGEQSSSGAKVCLYVKYCLQNKAVCYYDKGEMVWEHCSREDKEEIKYDRNTKRSIHTESSGSLSHNQCLCEKTHVQVQGSNQSPRDAYIRIF